MIIYKNNIKRIFTSKAKLFIIFIIPLSFFLLFLENNSGVVVKMSIIDKDQTEISRRLTEGLKDKNMLIEAREDTVKDLLIIGVIDYAIIIDKGFSESLLQEGDAIVKEQYFIDSGKIEPIRMYINNYIKNMKHLIANTDNEEQLYDRLDKSIEYFSVNESTIKKKSTEEAISGLGFMVQFILYMSIITTAFLLIDKEKNTIIRIVTSTVSKTRYMIENLLCFITVAFIQVIFIFAFYTGVMNLYFGHYFILVLVLMFLFSITAIALCMIVVALVKSEKIAYGIVLFSSSPLVMLGGCYFELTSMPESIQKISKFIPTSWVMNGARDLIIHNNASNIITNYVVLLTFAITFFIISIVVYRKNVAES